MKSRRWLLAGMFVGLVFLVFGAIEVALGAFGFGVPSQPFERHPYVGGFYVENNTFYNRYFDRSHWSKRDLNGSSIRGVFHYRKGPRMLRGFLLGESAAQGYPYHSNHTFGKMVEAALAASGRYEQVELVN